MNRVRSSARIRRRTSKPSTFGSFRSSRTSAGNGAAGAGFAEEELEGLGPVARDADLVEDVALLERPDGEGLVVGIVLDEQDVSGSHRVSLASRVNEIVAPWSTAPSAQMCPPWRSTMRRTLASPIPVPANSRAECRRWNGWNSFST